MKEWWGDRLTQLIAEFSSVNITIYITAAEISQPVRGNVLVTFDKIIISENAQAFGYCTPPVREVQR